MNEKSHGIDITFYVKPRIELGPKGSWSNNSTSTFSFRFCLDQFIASILSTMNDIIIIK